MPTREEMVRQLKRQDMIDHLKAQDAGDEGSGMGDFANSMIRGTSIAENMPGGSALASLGSKIGSGISAATMAPFSDKSFGELYDEGQGAMASADAERSAIDAKSPMAVGVKEIMGELPMMAMKREAPQALDMDTPTPGQFSYPADSTRERMSQYLKEKMARDPAAPGGGSSMMSTVLKEGEEMLPYKARLMLRLGRKFGGGQ